MTINLPFNLGDTMWFRGRFKALDCATIDTVKTRKNSTVVIAVTDGGFHITQAVGSCGKSWWLSKEEAIEAILADCPCEDKVSPNQCDSCFLNNLRKENAR